MTTKTAPKTQHDEPKSVDPSREEIQTAFQVHTLAQMLYGQLAAKHSWTAPTMTAGFEPRMGYPTAPWPQGWPRT